MKAKLTDKLLEDLAGYLEAGLFLEKACKAVGIHDSTLRRWMASPAPRYRTLQATITRARARAEGEALRHIAVASRTDWRAAAWYLERAHPETYGQVRLNPASWGKIPVARVEVTGPEGGPVPVAAGVFELDLEDLPEEALAAIVKQIEKRGQAGDIVDGHAREVSDGGDPAPRPD